MLRGYHKLYDHMTLLNVSSIVKIGGLWKIISVKPKYGANLWCNQIWDMQHDILVTAN